MLTIKANPLWRNPKRDVSDVIYVLEASLTPYYNKPVMIQEIKDFAEIHGINVVEVRTVTTTSSIYVYVQDSRDKAVFLGNQQLDNYTITTVSAEEYYS